MEYKRDKRVYGVALFSKEKELLSVGRIHEKDYQACQDYEIRTVQIGEDERIVGI